LENVHLQEFQDFMAAWDQAIRAFNDLSSVQLEQLRARQAREMEELRLYLEQATPLNAKPSPEILNMQRI
jgi:hypothetical protein